MYGCSHVMSQTFSDFIPTDMQSMLHVCGYNTQYLSDSCRGPPQVSLVTQRGILLSFTLLWAYQPHHSCHHG